jgi:hypothetical protein
MKIKRNAAVVRKRRRALLLNYKVISYNLKVFNKADR